MDQVLFDEPGLRVSTNKWSMTIRVDWRRHVGSPASLINRVVDYLQDAAVGSSLPRRASMRSAERPAQSLLTRPADIAAKTALSSRRLRRRQIHHGPSL